MNMTVICGSSSFFEDDKSTTCAECGKAIVHRPHVPEPSIKLCIQCGLDFILREKIPTVEVTEETVKELKELF